MPAGRPRKPLERRKATDRRPGVTADGTRYQTKEIAVREPTYVIPVPPDDLGDRGLTEWEKIWTAGTWLHEHEDYHWVAIIGRAYDDMVEFRKAVETDGLTVTGYMGKGTVAHPLIAEIRKCEQQIMKCLSMLGFSPTDRARLGLAEIQKMTGLANLQKRTRGNRADG